MLSDGDVVSTLIDDHDRGVRATAHRLDASDRVADGDGISDKYWRHEANAVVTERNCCRLAVSRSSKCFDHSRRHRGHDPDQERSVSHPMAEFRPPHQFFIYVIGGEVARDAGE